MRILSKSGSHRHSEVTATTALVMVTKLWTVLLLVTSPATTVKVVEVRVELAVVVK